MKYVALLRGINVGGRNMIKMEMLRATLGSLGFENVKSYINSGNLIFETAKTVDNELAERIHDAIKKDFDFDISVMVRSMDEIVGLIENNPFVGQFENDKDLHIIFLREFLSEDQEAILQTHNSENEKIAVRGREIFYLLRISIIDSVLGKGFIDKKLKIPATARNWRTVKKITEI
ncbi:MAG: DUF1697 domain-containing protein [Saprospiraceae bacterium]|nr:DUF1697 domain-containing protein [Pyrinomonadaceae bacterium]